VPVYEYRCRKCKNEFETLVRGQKVPSCPACSSEDLERLISLPTVSSEGTRNQALKAARQRDNRLGHERVAAQREYEAHHDD
jgi:putative FmdB family regulatory protein